ncbi:MAG: hypothetical protein ONB16_03360 [candidate division KSB1 bacterium]|nr:hypothetical protein [candidate division KSB1 bacterium]MDZ7342114.1 hypothetical protein [candidate division KSB1 bacterium]
MRSLIRGNYSQILVLFALLVVIIMIMTFLKSNEMKYKVSPVPAFDGTATVINDRYYNKAYNFGIARPNNFWEFSYHDRLDSLRKQDLTRPLLSNVNDLVRLFRRDLSDTISVVRTGIIHLAEPRNSQQLAEQCLQEILAAHPLPDTVRVIRGVTKTGYGSRLRAYFMIELPAKDRSPYPIWIVLFDVQQLRAYTIICQVRSELYDLLRKDFESILTSFRFYQS